MRQNAVVEGDEDPRDPQRPGVYWLGWRHGSVDHGGASGLAIEVVGDLVV